MPLVVTYLSVSSWTETLTSWKLLLLFSRTVVDNFWKVLLEHKEGKVYSKPSWIFSMCLFRSSWFPYSFSQDRQINIHELTSNGIGSEIDSIRFLFVLQRLCPILCTLWILLSAFGSYCEQKSTKTHFPHNLHLSVCASSHKLQVSWSTE